MKEDLGVCMKAGCHARGDLKFNGVVRCGLHYLEDVASVSKQKHHLVIQSTIELERDRRDRIGHEAYDAEAFKLLKKVIAKAKRAKSGDGFK